MKLTQGARVCAATFLEHFDNRPGYWTLDGLRAAVLDVLGDSVVWTAPHPSVERLERLAKTANEENWLRSEIVVALLPARTGSDWFQQVVAPNVDSMQNVLFLRGRVRMLGHATTPAYDSMLWLVNVPVQRPYAGINGEQDAYAGRMYETPATSYVMEHGARDVILRVQNGRVSFHDDRLARLVETGADYTATIRPKR